MKIMLLVVMVLSQLSFAGYFDANHVTEDGLLEDGEYGIAARVDGSSTLTVTGGGAESIDILGSAHLDVISTKIPLSDSYNGGGGIYDINVENYASLTFSGGVVDSIEIYNNATAILNGGTINSLEIYQYGSLGQTVRIECCDGWSWIYGIEQQIKGITGNWQNGTPFSIDFIDAIRRPDLNPPVHTHVEVVTPEPASLLMLGLGGLVLRKRK